jgi:hypothetical protein
MASGPAPFTVDRVPQVDRRIRDLAGHAKSKGILSEFLNTLTSIVEKLERDPLGWGDPEYHPESKKSTVCHGVHGGVFTRFVVFEDERLVILLELTVMPHSELD